jgi:hypothetical protein
LSSDGSGNAAARLEQMKQCYAPVSSKTMTSWMPVGVVRKPDKRILNSESCHFHDLNSGALVRAATWARRTHARASIDK